MPIPVNERGYAHPELLAETGWLAGNLTQPTLRIIDTRSPLLYEAGHIPGAVNLAAVGAIPRAADGDMGQADDFSRLASDLGVAPDSTVVIYDTPSPAMGMLAWSFLYYGHPDVKMLDGGFEKWSSEGRSTSTESTGYPAAHFEANLAEELYCSLDEAKASLGQPGTILWDTRRDDEYGGTTPASATTPRPGHIPDAIHLEWTELLDPDSKTVKPAPELHTLLGSRGITPESVINCY